MPNLIEHIAARFAYVHAQRVYQRFLAALREPERTEAHVLAAVLSQAAGSDLARRYDLAKVRSAADLKQAVPLHTYEDVRPYIDRVAAGERSALFAPDQRILMFATSSGTTAKPKLIPVTPRFVADYRRGWNTFGLKMLSDHPRAFLRAILQSSGRHDESYTAAGVPCGAITGLLARSQKRIVRRFYVGPPEVAHVQPPPARYYTLMRLGIVRDVSFAITANPATLIRLAQTASDESETLIRDVHDGTLSARHVPEAPLGKRLASGLRPNPVRSKELEALRQRHGMLRPRDYWNLEFVACWTGGSMGMYRDRLSEWFGPVPVRDVGLLASEGRVSLPLEDGTPGGVLDVTSGLFEFIPIAHWDSPQPETVSARNVAIGQEYVVVLTNSSGLIRYRLDDVVRVCGWAERAPVVEFLYRAGRVASVAGEKLTENQVVEALRQTCRQLGVPEFDFVLAPYWADPPGYRLSCPLEASPRLADTVDRALAGQNEEYASRRKSRRLGEIQIRMVGSGTIATMDRHLAAARGSTVEQYKRPCLFTRPGEDDAALNLAAD